VQTLEDGGRSGEERTNKTLGGGSVVRHLGRPLATQGSLILFFAFNKFARIIER
jgi:hypothetical protein